MSNVINKTSGLIYLEVYKLNALCKLRNRARLHSYKISVKEWSENTNAIGIYAKTGRYGGTYEHKDITSNFELFRKNQDYRD